MHIIIIISITVTAIEHTKYLQHLPQIQGLYSCQLADCTRDGSSKTVRTFHSKKMHIIIIISIALTAKEHTKIFTTLTSKTEFADLSAGRWYQEWFE